MRIMVWPSARGGIRSVVEGYAEDGFLAAQDVRLVSSYAEGGVVRRQLVALRAFGHVAALLAIRPVDLVHLHAAARGSFWRKAFFAGLARSHGVPVVLHLHGSEMRDFYDRQPSWLKRAIVGQLTRATHVVVLSESWRAFVADIAPGAKPTVVPNYVRVPERPARGTSQPVTLLFLGLLGRRKGVFDLLEAFAEARSSHSDMRLVIGGHGEIEAATRQARELALEDAVSFEGWVGPDDKAALLDAADIYVLPSHNEGLAMSVLEAMAYGLPVITTAVGGLPELVTDGVHGRVIRPGDIAALTAAILDLSRDRETRRRMGEAARARIKERYSGGVVLPRLAELYAGHESEPRGRPDRARTPSSSAA